MYAFFNFLTKFLQIFEISSAPDPIQGFVIHVQLRGQAVKQSRTNHAIIMK